MDRTGARRIFELLISDLLGLRLWMLERIRDTEEMLLLIAKLFLHLHVHAVLFLNKRTHILSHLGCLESCFFRFLNGRVLLKSVFRLRLNLLLGIV